MKKLLYGIVCSVILFSCDSYKDEYIEVDAIPKYTAWDAAADSSSLSFISVFWNETAHHFNNDNNGNIGRYDYWPEAHGLDVLIDAYLRTNDEKYKTRIYEFYEGVKAKNGNRFWNNFYDDMGWHGLAHLRAFEATGDTRYEESAKYLWGEVLKGWDDLDGGGIRWNHDNTVEGMSKGIPSTGPATIIAARRWQKYGNTESFEGANDSIWMMRCYDWIKEKRRVAETGRIFENVDDTGGDWTYNTGLFIGAALEIYNITGDKMYLNDAIKTSNWAMSALINIDTRVLSDWAEQRDHDVNLFKGIFVRYFTQLIMHPDLPEITRKRYIAFMQNSANYLWSMGTQKTPVILYGWHWWEVPEDGFAALRTQLSGCMMIEAMALLKKEGYLN